MKLFIVDNNKITKYKIPDKVNDSYMISYSNEIIKDTLISLIGKNNKWYIESNGTAILFDQDQEIDNKEIVLYQKYIIKIIGYNNPLLLYFVPTSEKLFKLKFDSLNSLSIGKNTGCNIFYDYEDIADVQAVLKKVNNDWVLTCVNDDNYKVFVNNKRAKMCKINFGDIIFISGIKIIWMNSFICINNPQNKLKIGGLELIKDDDNTLKEIKPVSEEEKVVELYNINDYYVPYPTIRETVLEKEVKIDAPPNSENQDTMPLILTMGSSVMMGSSAFVMAYNVVYGLNNDQEIARLIPQIIMMVSMIIGSLMMPAITRLYQKRKSKQKENIRIKKYSEYLDKKAKEIDLYIANETQIYSDTYLTLEECITALEQKNNNFYKYQNEDNDFLTVRLGTGRVKSKISINAPEEHFTVEEDKLLETIYALKSKYQYIDNAPITISLKQFPVTSFVFNDVINYNMIDNILAQLSILQSSLSLKIVIITNENNKSYWEFAKYLPHIFSEDKSVRFFALNVEEAKIVSNFLEEELKTRRENKDNVLYVPHYLIITDSYSDYKNIAIIDELINKDNENMSFSLLIIENTMKKVPVNSNAFVRFGKSDGAIIEKSLGLNQQTIFRFNNEENNVDMMQISKSLADVPVLSKDGPALLPTSLSFMDMFSVSKVEQLNITDRWQKNNPVLSLDTVVGVHKNGDPFTLNLHEKFHGPHGLIAGATGSGKSEFIITFILSMIINYHPYEVQFVLIDYKGGGLAGAFENRDTGVKIPHLAGTITNLDVSEMNRSLVSLQSELKRRQKVFNEVRNSLEEGTLDIYKYQKLYRQGIVKEPMAHLFIICDEFAELKQQQPDFMDELISISRIGRSLGVHLILATQKPSGVVNDQIWANSKFKVCLKVQDREDSMEMLKRPEAASIKETGRFYLQIGYDEYFDIGQSGWSGAKYVPSDKIVTKTDESVNYIDNVGYVLKTIKDQSSLDIDTKDYGDQLTNIVKYLYGVGKKEQIRINSLWLNAIPELIYVGDLKKKYNYTPKSFYINPVIGEYDDPVHQLQGLLSVDLSKKGNLVIYGATGSGKENLLLNLIRSVIVEHTPDEVNIYIIDCGSEALKIFNNYPHVGDVLTLDDADEINDLMKMVEEEIERRKELFIEYAGSYNDYIENSNERVPFWLIVINNYDIFVENFNDENERMQVLFRDCFKYGIAFAISVVSPNAIRTRTVGYFSNKITMKLNDPTDYRTILNSPKDLIPANFFGRGLIELNHGVFEFQTASFALKKDQVKSLRDLKDYLNKAYTSRARKIPKIPKIIYTKDLLEIAKNNSITPIGYNVDNKKVCYFDFIKNKISAIVTENLDESIGFFYSLIKLLSINNEVYVLDINNIVKSNIDNIKLINSDYEKFVKDFNVFLDFHKDYEKEIYIVINGVNNMKKKLNEEVFNKFKDIMSNIDNHPFVHIIIFDDNDSYKDIKYEDYFNLINSQNYIYLGSDLSSLTLFNTPNIPYNMKNKAFLYMAYVVRSNKYEIIKYVIEGDNNE